VVRRAYTAEQRELAEAARRAKVEQLHTEMGERMRTFDDRDTWQRFLRFATGFHSYSFLNQVALWTQMPTATLVAGYRAWQAKGHQVRRGEKALTVLAPILRKTPVLDAVGQPVLDEHGQPRFRREIVGVRPASVFDASQVDPEPIRPPQPTLLAGQAPPGLWAAVVGLAEREGFRVERGDCGRANGFTDFDDHLIRIRDDISDLAALKVALHEMGHVYTMDAEDIASYRQRGCRGVLEVAAESVAYVVLQAHGVDSSQYTFNYVAGWATQSSGDTTAIDRAIRATGDRVVAAAHRILTHTQPRPTAEDEILDARIDEVLGPTTGPAVIADANRAEGVQVWETVTAPPTASPPPAATTSASVSLAI
jgi:antirestriction protein ArdC